MFKTILSKISNNGIYPDIDIDAQYRIIFSNKMIAIGVFSSLAFSFTDYLLKLYWPSFLLLLLSFFHIFALYLVKIRKPDLSIFLLITMSATTLFAIDYFLIGDVGISYILLTLITIPLLCINPKETKYIIYSLVVLIVEFVISSYLQIQNLGIYHLTSVQLNHLLFSGIIQAIVLILGQATLYINLLKYKEQKQKKEEELKTNQCMLADLGMFSAGLAHEINNPLTIMKTYNHIIEKSISNKIDKDEYKTIQNMFSKLDDNIGKIHNIINQIKDFSSNDTTIIETFSLEHSLNTLIVFHKSFISKYNIKININIDSSIKIKGNKKNIERSISVIIKNAIDALENIPKGVISINTHSTNDFIYLTIKDNGNGIDKDIAKAIFKPFFTTKSPTKNTGLDLSFAKKTIKDADGELLLIDNNPATFQIKLPKINNNN